MTSVADLMLVGRNLEVPIDGVLLDESHFKGYGLPLTFSLVSLC